MQDSLIFKISGFNTNYNITNTIIQNLLLIYDTNALMQLVQKKIDAIIYKYYYNNNKDAQAFKNVLNALPYENANEILLAQVQKYQTYQDYYKAIWKNQDNTNFISQDTFYSGLAFSFIKWVGIDLMYSHDVWKDEDLKDAVVGGLVYGGFLNTYDIDPNSQNFKNTSIAVIKMPDNDFKLLMKTEQYERTIYLQDLLNKGFLFDKLLNKDELAQTKASTMYEISNIQEPKKEQVATQLNDEKKRYEDLLIQKQTELKQEVLNRQNRLNNIKQSQNNTQKIIKTYKNDSTLPYDLKNPHFSYNTSYRVYKDSLSYESLPETILDFYSDTGSLNNQKIQRNEENVYLKNDLKDVLNNDLNNDKLVSYNALSSFNALLKNKTLGFNQTKDITFIPNAYKDLDKPSKEYDYNNIPFYYQTIPSNNYLPYLSSFYVQNNEDINDEILEDKLYQQQINKNFENRYKNKDGKFYDFVDPKFTNPYLNTDNKPNLTPFYTASVFDYHNDKHAPNSSYTDVILTDNLALNDYKTHQNYLISNVHYKSEDDTQKQRNNNLAYTDILRGFENLNLLKAYINGLSDEMFVSMDVLQDPNKKDVIASICFDNINKIYVARYEKIVQLDDGHKIVYRHHNVLDFDGQLWYTIYDHYYLSKDNAIKPSKATR